jgi:hypothetical protein
MGGMDRRVQAALACAAAAGGTAIVAMLTAHSPTRPTVDPTSVTVLAVTDLNITFLVRGAGCPAPPGAKDARGRRVKSPVERIRSPTIEYTDRGVEVGFRVEDPGQWLCTGPDPGVRYYLVLPIALSGSPLLDADQKPPQPFPTEAPTDQSPAPSPAAAPAGSPSPTPRRTDVPAG